MVYENSVVVFNVTYPHLIEYSYLTRFMGKFTFNFLLQKIEFNQAHLIRYLNLSGGHPVHLTVWAELELTQTV